MAQAVMRSNTLARMGRLAGAHADPQWAGETGRRINQRVFAGLLKPAMR